MAGSITITGLSPSDLVPGTYMQVNLGVGASSGVDAPISVLLMGAKLSTAPASVDGYVYGPDVEGFTCTGESDVVSLFGAGSELHRAYRAFTKVNTVNSVYFVAVTESGGSAATGSVVLSGTATANGYIRCYVGDEWVDVSVVSGDTAATIAGNLRDAINSKAHWAVTASAVSSTVTITAKNKGPRGNKIRFAAKAVGSFGITSGAQNFAFMSGGNTSDSWTSALATIASRNFRYIVAAAEDSAGNAKALADQVATQALPINDKRQRCLFGNVDSIGTVNAWAQALNNPRAGVVWQKNSNLSPFELAASAAAAFALGESASVPVLNWDNLGATPATAALWKVGAPFDGTTPSRNDIKSALVSGVSPVATDRGGRSRLVSAITTYSLDSGGNLDLRVRDHHIITVMDLAADRIQSMCNQQFANKLVADDPAKGARAPGGAVVTPSILAASINKVLREMAQDGLLENIDATVAATQVVRDTTPDSRLTARVQLDVVGVLHQIAVALDHIA